MPNIRTTKKGNPMFDFTHKIYEFEVNTRCDLHKPHMCQACVGARGHIRYLLRLQEIHGFP